ncbi:lipoprotein [Endomicrobium proavitum]|uniref:Lipoprotein n=1 Tax=Endomicrobium proavitum TaxID=1408281 RepID=A0A0G3WJU2_9BACT|nr:lipoprotein [Endomicrobium proavitum]AKL98563.1 conserved exported protein of unknown function [Endomicrobium proavitum]
MKKIVFTAAAVLFLASCSVLDYPARFAGFSIQKFEGEDAAKVSQSFNMSISDCFNKTLEIINKMHARVTHKSVKNNYIVAFDFSKSFDYCLDSTEAAFFLEQDGDYVKVTVVSNNGTLTANLSKQYFQMMSAPPQTPENKSAPLQPQEVKTQS